MSRTKRRKRAYKVELEKTSLINEATDEETLEPLVGLLETKNGLKSVYGMSTKAVPLLSYPEEYLYDYPFQGFADIKQVAPDMRYIGAIYHPDTGGDNHYIVHYGTDNLADMQWTDQEYEFIVYDGVFENDGTNTIDQSILFSDHIETEAFFSALAINRDSPYDATYESTRDTFLIRGQQDEFRPITDPDYADSGFYRVGTFVNDRYYVFAGNGKVYISKTLTELKEYVDPTEFTEFVEADISGTSYYDYGSNPTACVYHKGNIVLFFVDRVMFFYIQSDGSIAKATRADLQYGTPNERSVEIVGDEMYFVGTIASGVVQGIFKLLGYDLTAVLEKDYVRAYLDEENPYLTQVTMYDKKYILAPLTYQIDNENSTVMISVDNANLSIYPYPLDVRSGTLLDDGITYFIPRLPSLDVVYGDSETNIINTLASVKAIQKEAYTKNIDREALSGDFDKFIINKLTFDVNMNDEAQSDYFSELELTPLATNEIADPLPNNETGCYESICVAKDGVTFFTVGSDFEVTTFVSSLAEEQTVLYANIVGGYLFVAPEYGNTVHSIFNNFGLDSVAENSNVTDINACASIVESIAGGVYYAISRNDHRYIYYFDSVGTAVGYSEITDGVLNDDEESADLCSFPEGYYLFPKLGRDVKLINSSLEYQTVQAISDTYLADEDDYSFNQSLTFSDLSVVVLPYHSTYIGYGATYAGMAYSEHSELLEDEIDDSPYTAKAKILDDTSKIVALLWTQNCYPAIYDAVNDSVTVLSTANSYDNVSVDNSTLVVVFTNSTTGEVLRYDYTLGLVTETHLNIGENENFFDGPMKYNDEVLYESEKGYSLYNETYFASTPAASILGEDILKTEISTDKGATWVDLPTQSIFFSENVNFELNLYNLGIYEDVKFRLVTNSNSIVIWRNLELFHTALRG